MGFQKLAAIAYRYPIAIILFWTLFLVIFGYYAPKLSTVVKGHGLQPNGAYVQVERLLSTEFHIPEDPAILVFEKKENVSRQQFQLFIQQTLVLLRGVDGLSEMVSPLEREGMLKGNFAFALLAFHNGPHEMKQVIGDIQRRLPDNRHISVKMTGKSVVQADVNSASRQDLIKAERIGIPVAFIILWIAFGGILAALIPIVIGMFAVTGTMGIMSLLGTKIELSNFVLNVIPMVGLALSIDFALLLVSRFRDELKKESAAEALTTTMKTAGRAVFFSAVCILLGLVGILFIPLPMFSTIAIGAMTVLAVSVLLTLTFVPALLTILWPALQSGSKPSHTDGRKTWYRISLFIMKRPVRMALLASFMLMSLLLPLNHMKVAIPDASSLPQNYASRMAFEVYQTHFDSRKNSNVYVIAQGAGSELTEADWINAYALVQKWAIDPYVQKVDSVFSSLRMPPEQVYLSVQNPLIKSKYEPVIQQFVNDNKMFIQVTLKGEPSSGPVRSWLRLQELEGESSDLRYRLGGEGKYQQEVFDAIFHNIKFVFLFIVASNFIVLFFAFRSILIPLKTIAMNLLSLGASFGILVWIFREGRLGMEPDNIAIMIPVFIFGLAFGISMDYGVFLVSRIFEAYQQTQDNRQAVLEGLTSISRIINSAAAIMIAVTLPFAFGEVVGVKQLGIGIAAAIFIDATVIRMVLVPALMRMFGKWNWWAPGWSK
ncbi:MMPL family transporter [Paenibacillus montanisoli]|uniref:MMPL family transporter n=1 Tax=Paenibacillus montanisoli TaxID=2081970 RepID=A0A328U419_9BACL|nr:MMPL family transporter [Paenibacillus montanisoli]RAP77548.1 MMPL family transporter [Paenibacillus montanisoli]